MKNKIINWIREILGINTLAYATGRFAEGVDSSEAELNRRICLLRDKHNLLGHAVEDSLAQADKNFATHREYHNNVALEVIRLEERVRKIAQDTGTLKFEDVVLINKKLDALLKHLKLKFINQDVHWNLIEVVPTGKLADKRPVWTGRTILTTGEQVVKTRKPRKS